MSDPTPATGTDTVTPPAPAVPTAPAVATDADPKPTETVEFWKQKAREQETRAKANHEAAQRLQVLEDAQKTESQRLAEATAKAQREADEARAETTRYRVAATHGVTADYFDMLGSGTEEEISARAQRIAPLLGLPAENAQLRAEIEALKTGKPVPSAVRPVVNLKPGATPDAAQTEADLTYSSLFGAEK